jgi:putative two-component system response regulator
LVVDDEPVNLKAMQQILEADHVLLFATDGQRAIELAVNRQPDLILLDVLMDGIDGYEVCRRLKANPATARIPIIFVTALDETENEETGFDLGAVDYIAKPVKPSIVRARVRTHLNLVHAEELRHAHLELMHRLGRAAEFKTDESSGHIIRMSHYCRLLALALGCSERWAEDLLYAAPLHDVGKIGVPDMILNKPGKLDEGEWSVIRNHPEMGAAILGGAESGTLAMARTVALQHHEKFDGSGYPYGLVGEQISLEARIVAIADVFDALTTKRAYKEAWAIEEALDYIQDQSGSHFDPELVDVFVTLRDGIDAIYAQFADPVDA